MLAWAAHCALWVTAAVAINATHVVVGQTIDLSGMFAEFGVSSRVGLAAAFCEMNTAGGVLGRNLTLVTLDDGHDPDVAQRNFDLLVGYYNASILAATYAIDTFDALLERVEQTNLPYIGPHVGTLDTRSPFHRQVINLRASWFLEIAAHAKLLVEHLRVQRIACFYEYDDWGPELFPALVGWLAGVDMRFVATGTFLGDDAPTVAPAVESLLNATAPAQAVLMLAEEDRVLQFLALYRNDSRADPNCTFHILSIGASPSFAAKVGSAQWPNLFFTQMVPSPAGAHLIARRFAGLGADCLPAQYRTDAMAFEAYIVGRLIAEVLRQMDPHDIGPEAILDRVYTSHLFYLDDLPLGLYMDNTSGCGTVLCSCNVGLREVFISTLDHRMGTWTSYTDFPEFKYSVTTCEAPNGLVRPVLFGQLVPADDAVAQAIGLAIRAGILAAYDAEVNPAGGLFGAPFELVTVAYAGDAVAFCIVFTDIQSSTSLWATIFDVMAGALDVRHRLIRKLIVKHKCYEVKTIGDSFMCATKSPTQAVRFALALQEEFVQHDWGTDRIDRVYAEMVGMEVRAPGCWNGLRVRVGIHYGYGNIKLDPVSKGYDYYGTVVNTAARIEGVCHGGQIGVSEAVFLALDHHVPGAVCEDLGPQPLRGLAEPLRLYQVLPEGLLAQRRFPPLRIDRVDGKDEALASAAAAAEDPGGAQFSHPPHGVVPTDSSEASFGMHGKWAEMHPLVARGDITVEDLRHHYSILQIGLTTILAPLGKAFRQQVLRELCARLHVPNHGLEGPQLRSTLHGVIQRVLPATVAQQPGSDRRFSRASVGVHSDPSRPSPHRIAASLKDSPLSNRARADRHDWTQEAMSVEHADSL